MSDLSALDTRMDFGALGFINFRPVPDVQPFSLRSGATFDSILETIRVWIRDELQPYLEENNPQIVFAQNAHIFLDAITAAFQAQVPIADGVIAAVLATATSSTRAGLDGRYVIHAPSPSGSDDTGMLQALSLAASTSTKFGEIHLQHGTYIANIVCNGGVNMPLIVGKGAGYTKIKASTATAPVLKFVGGPSGNIAGGGARDLSLYGHSSGGGIGIQFTDCDGVTCQDVAITGDGTVQWDVGIKYVNTGVGGWSEFDTFLRGSISWAKLPVHYANPTNNTGEMSYHGSGLIETVIGLTTTSSTMVLIDDHAFPYNAPMTVHLFNAKTGQVLIRNNSANRAASFYGHLSLELPNGDMILGDGSNYILFRGDIAALSGGHTTLGKFWFVESVNYDNTIVRTRLKPFDQEVVCSNTPNVFGAVPFIDGSDVFLVVVTVSSTSGYRWTGVCYAFQTPGVGTGVVTAPTQLEYINQGAAWGAGVLRWSGGGLILDGPTNGSFPTDGSVKATASFTPLGGGMNGRRFPH